MVESENERMSFKKCVVGLTREILFLVQCDKGMNFLKLPKDSESLILGLRNETGHSWTFSTFGRELVDIIR